MSAIDPIGKQIGNYQVRTLLGSGGMGAVYLAFDTQLHREVALKRMHAHISGSENSSQRFLAEARSIARLSHPNIVVVYTFALDAETPYLVMEYVSGGSLRNYLDERYKEAGKLLQISEVLRLLRQVADALDYAHANGIVHRDVKPGNILLKTHTASDGGADFRAVLSDFGVVKLLEATGFNTQGVIGTPRYMAPEQLEAGAVDGRTDLYALGIVLYELVTGRPPFKPDNIRDAWHMHAEQQPPLPRTLRPDIPNELAAVMMKAIAKRPDQRYQTGQEMNMALQHLEQTVLAITELDRTMEATRLDNMGTYLQSRPASMPTAPLASVVDDLDHDRLVIQAAHKSKPTYVRLDQPSLTIGRGLSAEIVLSGRGVSRRHATIDCQPDGGYTITDLGSTNGTLLDGVKLLAHVAEPLRPGQRVGLGTFTLELQVKTGPTGENSLAALGFSADQTSYLAIPAEALAAISFAPKDTTLEAGQSATLQVEIANGSQVVRHFRLETDLSPVWIPAPPEPVRLLPGERRVVPLTITVPRAPSSVAGEYPFQVRSIDDDLNTVIGQGGGILTVEPFFQMETDLYPVVVRGPGEMELTVRNLGNSQLQATIAARDPEAALLFNPAQTVVTVNPGEAQPVTLEVMPHPQVAVLAERRYPFEITVTPEQAEPQTQRGEMIAVPLPPLQKSRRWPCTIAMGLLGLVMLLGAVLGDMVNLLGGGDDTSTAILSTPTPDPLILAEQGVEANADWTPIIDEFDGVEMVLMPVGCFIMGSEDGDDDEAPIHLRCIEEPFWIDRYEVTQEQFEVFGGQAANSSGFPGRNRPRERITWFEARDYCELRGARLPTEKEWEYAARGPDSLVYPWGNEFEEDNVVYGGNSDNQTAEVGSRPGGVSWVEAYDMSGNVWEWTNTIYEDYPYDAGDGRESNSDTNSARVLRGGSFNHTAYGTRSAARSVNAPDSENNLIGFRCVRSS